MSHVARAAELRAVTVLPPEAHARWLRSLSLSDPFELAMAGGAGADRLGSAFAAGYLAAVRALFGEHAGRGWATLSVTERGGNLPRHIHTTLTPEAGQLRLRGQKRWATLADRADALMVVASEGERDGRKVLVVVRVPREQLRLTPMPPPPFCPEIQHFEVDLDLLVSPDARLPGDAWPRWVRPFRVVEDLHVLVATTTLLLRTLGPDAAPALLASLASLSALAGSSPEEPAVILGLAGVRAQLDPWLEPGPAWASVPPEVTARWEQDRALLQIAGAVRAELLRRAQLTWAG